MQTLVEDGRSREALLSAREGGALRLARGGALVFEHREDEVKAFRSEVTALAVSTREKAVITVNDPFAFGDWTFYQVNYDPLGALIETRITHDRSRQPLLRNRLNYWFPAFILILIGDALLFISRPFQGNPLRLLATVLATYVIVTHDPPDLRELAHRVLIYLITTLLIVGFYVAGFTASQTIFRALPRYSPLVVGAVIALLISFVFTPLLSLVRRWVGRWLHIDEFHAGRTLQIYSQQISNILDMQNLASVAVGLIIEAMGITRGFLFLVDVENSTDDHKVYRLRAVRNPGERQIRILELTDEHPLVKHLMQEGRPLLQYDRNREETPGRPSCCGRWCCGCLPRTRKPERRSVPTPGAWSPRPTGTSGRAWSCSGPGGSPRPGASSFWPSRTSLATRAQGTTSSSAWRNRTSRRTSPGKGTGSGGSRRKGTTTRARRRWTAYLNGVDRNRPLLPGTVLQLPLFDAIPLEEGTAGASKDILAYPKRTDQEEAERLYRSGLGRFQAGNLEKAAADWEMALRFDPDHAKARKELSRVRRMLKKLE